MASNVFKVVWQYTGPLGTSWNEVYYATGNVPTDLLTFDTGAINGRLSLLHPACFHSGISVAQVGNTRLTAQRKTGWAGTGTGTAGPAIPESAMVCQLVGQGGGSRKIWIRGLPEYLIGLDSASGRSIFGPFTTAAFSQYVAGLARMGYGVRTLTSQPKYQIVSVAPGTNTGTAVITFALGNNPTPPVWGSNPRVIITQTDAKTLPGLKGHFTVLATTTTSFTIRYVVAGAQTITSNAGFFKLESYSGVNVFAPALCAPAYWGSHDTKVFTRGSRGAKRAVRVRTLA